MLKQNARNFLVLATAIAALAGSSASGAMAQQAKTAQVAPQTLNTAPPSAGAAVKAKAKAGGGGEAAGDSGVTRRVEQLEEQIVDMQVTVGTLESLSRSGGGAVPRNGSPGAAMSSTDTSRVDGLETQVRALAAEVQRLNAEIRRLGGSSNRGDAGGGATRSGYADAAPTTYVPPSNRRDAVPAFGSTTVTPNGGDPIGTLIEGAPGDATATVPGSETQVAGLPPAASGSPKQDYEAAYGHLLRQDYGAAESAFDDFLKTYPSDPLAGNAQYWLGETHFVRGSYKPAAAAFLKGYQNFARSNKAPDSLLKLAMSLDRLGQKDAACSSFGELVGKFPDAPSHVKSRAASEQKRLGCR